MTLIMCELKALIFSFAKCSDINSIIDNNDGMSDKELNENLTFVVNKLNYASKKSTTPTTNLGLAACVGNIIC